VQAQRRQPRAAINQVLNEMIPLEYGWAKPFINQKLAKETEASLDNKLRRVSQVLRVYGY
jgi:hypothetical protein